MIAVDTNVLVYAHRADSPFHTAASRRVRGLAEGDRPWAIPWPCLHEFYSVVTHPRIYAPASTSDQAIAQLEAWLASPSVVLLAERSGYERFLTEVLRDAEVRGPFVHDARIAALCRQHGVRTLISQDRDFSRFAGLRTEAP